MVNRDLSLVDNRIVYAAYAMLFSTIFMSFTDKGTGLDIDLSRDIFSIILIDKEIRGNLYFVLNEIPLLFILYNRRQNILKLAFYIVLSKFAYNFGILVGLWQYEKGYSDYLNVLIVALFLFFDLYNKKWKSQLGLCLEYLSHSLRSLLQ